MDTLGTMLAFPLLAATTESINAMHLWSLLRRGWTRPARIATVCKTTKNRRREEGRVFTAST